MSPRDYCRLRAFFVLSIGLLVVSGSGCTSVRPSGVLPLMSGAKPEEADATSNQPFCTVELRGVGTKARMVKVPLTEQMRVTEVVKSSKASKKFSRFDAHIWRKSPRKAHEMVKLDVRFDPESGQVTYDTDYAIHPDDRIVVVEQPYTIFDEAYNSLLGPILGQIGRR